MIYVMEDMPTKWFKFMNLTHDIENIFWEVHLLNSKWLLSRC